MKYDRIYVCCNGFSKRIAAYDAEDNFDGKSMIVDYSSSSGLQKLLLILRCFAVKSIYLPHLGGRIFRLIYKLRNRRVLFIDDGLAPVALVPPPPDSKVVTFENFAGLYEELDSPKFSFLTTRAWQLEPSQISIDKRHQYIFVSSAGLNIEPFRDELAHSLYVLHPRDYKNKFKDDIPQHILFDENVEGILLNALISGHKIVLGRSISTIALAIAARDQGIFGNLIVSIEEDDPLKRVYSHILEKISKCT